MGNIASLLYNAPMQIGNHFSFLFYCVKKSWYCYCENLSGQKKILKFPFFESFNSFFQVDVYKN